MIKIVKRNKLKSKNKGENRMESVKISPKSAKLLWR